MNEWVQVTKRPSGARKAWKALSTLLLIALSLPSAAKVPKSLEPELGAQLAGRTLAVETTTMPNFYVGPSRIGSLEEFTRAQEMLGVALPAAPEEPALARSERRRSTGEGGFALDASGFVAPAPGIAADLAMELQQRYGLVPAADTNSGDYLLLVEPTVWQLYHRSLLSDPSYYYSTKVSLLAMPARTPLVVRHCSHFNWHAVEKPPFLLNYFGDDAAAFRADIEDSRSTCSAELIEKMLPLPKRQ